MKINLIYMTDADKFINYISVNYSKLKWKYYRFCIENHLSWDEDIYSDTIVKCYDTIKKNGKLKDTSPYGIECYFFLAFKNNIRNEKRYCRNKNRDFNITSDNINDLYEEYYNLNNDSSRTKLEHDLYQDFTMLYIMMKVNEHFDEEHSYLFKLKTLTKGMTFKKLAERCRGIKSTRKKVIDVIQWIKQNITKEEIRKAFFQEYDYLIDY